MYTNYSSLNSEIILWKLFIHVLIKTAIPGLLFLIYNITPYICNSWCMCLFLFREKKITSSVSFFIKLGLIVTLWWVFFIFITFRSARNWMLSKGHQLANFFFLLMRNKKNGNSTLFTRRSATCRPTSPLCLQDVYCSNCRGRK